MPKLLFFILLLAIPFKIGRMISTRKKSNAEERKQYDQILLRSILIGIVFMSLFVTTVVFYAVNFR